MKALTLWPEWAYAVQRLGKDGENRTRPIPPSLIGQPFAIHAGLRAVHAEPCSTRLEELKAYEEALEDQGILTSATFAESIRGHVVAVVRCGASVPRSSARWAAPDQHFWPFLAVQILPTPVDCRNDGICHQGLWTLGPVQETAIRAQL